MSPRPPTILVVDDEPSIRETLQEILEWSGYRVRLAQDGVEALAMIQAERPDLVLLDYMMPRMDGVQTLQALAKVPGGSKLPVIMISAVDVRERAPEARIEHFIHKPFEVDDLLEAIRKLLGGPGPGRR